MINLSRITKGLFTTFMLTASLSYNGQSLYAQVKVGENPATINAGSALEIESNTKGLLLPRVTLLNTNTWQLAGTPVAGMQIYNNNPEIIGTADYPIVVEGVGIYYWDGLGWVAAKAIKSNYNGDFDWLRTDDNGNPSDAQDIVKRIYHGGAGNQQVTVRTTDSAPSAFAEFSVRTAHGNSQDEINGRFFAENHPTDGPLVGLHSIGNPLVFRTSAEWMRITSQGRVGIGTKVPNFDFQVKGAIVAANTSVFSQAQTAAVIQNGTIELTAPTAGPSIDFKDNISKDYDASIFYFKEGDEGSLRFSVSSNGQSGGSKALLSLNSNGTVSVGGFGGSQYEFEVSGDINATGEVRNSGLALTSDRRLKRNIMPFQKGLEVVSKLEPVSYEKKATIADSIFKRSEIGFIAQEVYKVLPQLVKEGRDADKTLALDYNSLIPILTRAIQEQQKQIELLESERKAQSVQMNLQSAKLEVQSNRLDAQSTELLEIKRLLNLNPNNHTNAVSR